MIDASNAEEVIQGLCELISTDCVDSCDIDLLLDNIDQNKVGALRAGAVILYDHGVPMNNFDPITSAELEWLE